MQIFSQQPPPLVRWGFRPSPLGKMEIGLTEDGSVCLVGFTPKIRAQWRRTSFVEDNKVAQEIADRLLDEAFHPPLCLTGTLFQQRVWQELLKIPRGKTRRYAEIARRIQNPKAMRAVGTACGANPVVVFVPCHRVIRGDGGGGGYVGGLANKTRLLAGEGVRL